MYDTASIIKDPVSNNAFSYSKRATFHNCTPKIHIPSLIKGSSSDLKPGTETVFEDYDGEELKSCAGLQNFIKAKHPKSGASVYIFDNHNHAFYFWHHERNKGTISAGLSLIHIDQHKDTRQPAKLLSPEDSQDDQKLFKYTNEVLNVGNFIPPALQTGLISRVFNIDSEATLDLPQSIPTQYILDIDIDFFAPELDYIDNQKKINTIKKLLSAAKLITVATSPFFMDQRKAISLIDQIFS